MAQRKVIKEKCKLSKDADVQIEYVASDSVPECSPTDMTPTKEMQSTCEAKCAPQVCSDPKMQTTVNLCNTKLKFFKPCNPAVSDKPLTRASLGTFLEKQCGVDSTLGSQKNTGEERRLCTIQAIH